MSRKIDEEDEEQKGQGPHQQFIDGVRLQQLQPHQPHSHTHTHSHSHAHSLNPSHHSPQRFTRAPPGFRPPRYKSTRVPSPQHQSGAVHAISRTPRPIPNQSALESAQQSPALALHYTSPMSLAARTYIPHASLNTAATAYTHSPAVFARAPTTHPVRFAQTRSGQNVHAMQNVCEDTITFAPQQLVSSSGGGDVDFEAHEQAQHHLQP